MTKTYTDEIPVGVDTRPECPQKIVASPDDDTPPATRGGSSELVGELTQINNARY